jgi:ribose transport system permease protein
LAAPSHVNRKRLDRPLVADWPKLIERIGLILAWAAVIGVFTYLRPGLFFTTQNFATIFSSQAVLVVLALGLLLPLTAGDYDLSAAAVLTLASTLLAVLNVQRHWPLWPAIAVVLLAGVGVGLVNGALTVLLKIDSFIVTLGVGTTVGGVVLWITNSTTISGISPELSNLVIEPKVFKIGLGFFYALALCALLWYVFEFTRVGRHLLFVGKGRRVSRLSGLRVGALRWGAMAGCSLISAFAGVLYAGTSGSADPTSGLSFLLPAFAAAFLGSTSIVPGRFNPWGTFIAVYFLVTGITGLALLGVQVFVQDLFYGSALVIGVAVAQIAKGRFGDEGDEER